MCILLISYQDFSSNKYTLGKAGQEEGNINVIREQSQCKNFSRAINDAIFVWSLVLMNEQIWNIFLFQLLLE